MTLHEHADCPNCRAPAELIAIWNFIGPRPDPTQGQPNLFPAEALIAQGAPPGIIPEAAPVGCCTVLQWCGMAWNGYLTFILLVIIVLIVKNVVIKINLRHGKENTKPRA